MSRNDAQQWLDTYDTVGIRPDAEPPASLMDLARNATHIIASDLPRAIESAARLARGREIGVSSLLRESKLPVPQWPARMPFVAWGLAVHTAWILRITRGVDVTESERARAAESIDWLTRLVGDSSVAVVVTHGVFRRMLASELIRRGWSNTGRRGGYRHWSSWSFSRD